MSRIHNTEFYREPGFLAFVWFGPYPASKLSLFLGLPICRRSNLLTREGICEEPNQTTARKLTLYKSFSALCQGHTRRRSTGAAHGFLSWDPWAAGWRFDRRITISGGFWESAGSVQKACSMAAHPAAFSHSGKSKLLRMQTRNQSIADSDQLKPGFAKPVSRLCWNRMKTQAIDNKNWKILLFKSSRREA